ncbi:MAG: PhoH family protein [bacterium]
MIKDFVLDTTVLLADANSIFMFADNNLIIPLTVIEEVDNFKRDLSDIGRNARQISRSLDALRKQNRLDKGVRLETGGLLRIDTGESFSLKDDYPKLTTNNDNKIMATALHLQKRDERPVILVTKDFNLRIKADALGLTAQDFESSHVTKNVTELFTGTMELSISEQQAKEFREKGSFSTADFRDGPPNICVRLSTSPEQETLGRYQADKNEIRALAQGEVWDLKPRNSEQRFAMDLLLDDSIRLVTLSGIAGTGKTLLALAAGLYKVTDEQAFAKMLVSRPIFPMGKDLGYLPGNVEEKLNPWMKPIFDNIELLMGGAKKKQGDQFAEMQNMGLIEIEPLTYIRGRSMPNQYMLVDEAQNLTHHEIKTIITRAGENTKIVLTGDPFQIDNPYIDSVSNGLSYVIEHFKNEPIAGHVTLAKGERSELAELAARLL